METWHFKSILLLSKKSKMATSATRQGTFSHNCKILLGTHAPHVPWSYLPRNILHLSALSTNLVISLHCTEYAPLLFPSLHGDCKIYTFTEDFKKLLQTALIQNFTPYKQFTRNLKNKLNKKDFSNLLQTLNANRCNLILYNDYHRTFNCTAVG